MFKRAKIFGAPQGKSKWGGVGKDLRHRRWCCQ